MYSGVDSDSTLMPSAKPMYQFLLTLGIVHLFTLTSRTCPNVLFNGARTTPNSRY